MIVIDEHDVKPGRPEGQMLYHYRDPRGKAMSEDWIKELVAGKQKTKAQSEVAAQKMQEQRGQFESELDRFWSWMVQAVKVAIDQYDRAVGESGEQIIEDVDRKPAQRSDSRAHLYFRGNSKPHISLGIELQLRAGITQAKPSAMLSFNYYTRSGASESKYYDIEPSDSLIAGNIPLCVKDRHHIIREDRIIRVFLSDFLKNA
jgi:hypothetical protein